MKNILFYWFLFLVVFLMLYQDLPLVNYFGEIARSPIIFTLPLLLIYIFSQQKILISRNGYYFLTLIGILYILSIFKIGIIYYQLDSLIVLNENVIIKTLKMSIYPITGFIFYIFWYSVIKNTKNINEILYRIFKNIQLFYVVFIFFEILNLNKTASFLPFLYSSSEKYWRIRLLTLEESWTGCIIILLTFFPIYLVSILKKSSKEKRRRYFFSLLLILMYSVVSQSKGFLLLTVISILPLIVKNLLSNPYFKTIRKILLPVVLSGFILLVVILSKLVFNQFYTSITFGTRLSSILAALSVFIENPLGVGWPGMIYNFPEKINEIVSKDLMDDFKLLEIKSYITSAKALSSKSYFLDSLMQGGIFFLYFFYKFFVKTYIKLLKVEREVWLKIIALYFIMAGIIYITFDIKYEIWFVFAYIEVLINRKNNEYQKNLNSM